MLSISPELRSLITPEGAVILNISADRMITINPTGAYIWARLQEGKTIDQIIESLAAETGHDLVLVANDVQEFLEQMAEKRLLSL
jgi:Coenzyme PQQ synthesis protein D (PqqD)